MIAIRFKPRLRRLRHREPGHGRSKLLVQLGHRVGFLGLSSPDHLVDRGRRITCGLAYLPNWEEPSKVTFGDLKGTVETSISTLDPVIQAYIHSSMDFKKDFA